MSGGSLLILLALGVPLGMGLACLSPGFRARALAYLPLAPLPALLAALLAPGDTLVLAPAPLRLTLALDEPGALLLGGAALLWTTAGAYARLYMREDPDRDRFAVWWLLTLAGTLGVFLVADLASFYLAFALASIPAYGLVSHANSPAAERAGGIYMTLALLGEAFLLLAFVMLAAHAGAGNPLIREAVASLPASPWRDPILALLILGFGLKMGLVPLHVWMPLAHPVAPMPASAALSGIVVKAGVIGLIRFLPLEAGLAGWGTALILIGLFTAWYAVAVGITQRHPKTVLAYSTVSQMGFVAAILGAGLAAGDGASASLAAFYGLHHMLVKGALFLGVGIALKTGRTRAAWVMVPMAILALSLAGLPFTSGALAKFAGKELLKDGVIGLLATLSAAGSALLMLHFLQCLSRSMTAEPGEAAPAGLLAPWAVLAGSSILLPWLLFAGATGLSPRAPLMPYALWASLWPLLIGAALALLLRRAEDRLPAIPEGDLVVVAEAGLPAMRRFGARLERADDALRRWPVACAGLIGLILILGVLLRSAP
ncbi:complex I subunit 5 family protein [Ancylobacter terrae]|uniref:complex I subunit 5 family protein n=1 Tax=Ancylobacter sp. sgz301288 TaxID=3342077 RepID=UPI00385BA75D